MICLLRADCDAQCVGQAIGIHAAHHEAVLLKEGIRRVGMVLLVCRKVHQNEIADTGRDIQPQR